MYKAIISSENMRNSKKKKLPYFTYITVEKNLLKEIDIKIKLFRCFMCYLDFVGKKKNTRFITPFKIRNHDESSVRHDVKRVKNNLDKMFPRSNRSTNHEESMTNYTLQQRKGSGSKPVRGISYRSFIEDPWQEPLDIPSNNEVRSFPPIGGWSHSFGERVMGI